MGVEMEVEVESKAPLLLEKRVQKNM